MWIKWKINGDLKKLFEEYKLRLNFFCMPFSQPNMFHIKLLEGLAVLNMAICKTKQSKIKFLREEVSKVKSQKT